MIILAFLRSYACGWRDRGRKVGGERIKEMDNSLERVKRHAKFRGFFELNSSFVINLLARVDFSSEGLLRSPAVLVSLGLFSF